MCVSCRQAVGKASCHVLPMLCLQMPLFCGLCLSDGARCSTLIAHHSLSPYVHPLICTLQRWTCAFILLVHVFSARLVLWLGAVLGLVGYGAVFITTTHAAAATANLLGKHIQGYSSTNILQQHITGSAFGGARLPATAAAVPARATTSTQPSVTALAVAAVAFNRSQIQARTSDAAFKSWVTSSAAAGAFSGEGVHAGSTAPNGAVGTTVSAELAAACMPVLMLTLVLAGCSGNMMDTGALVTNVRNFPSDRSVSIVWSRLTAQPTAAHSCWPRAGVQRGKTLKVCDSMCHVCLLSLLLTSTSLFFRDELLGWHFCYGII